MYYYEENNSICKLVHRPPNIGGSWTDSQQADVNSPIDINNESSLELLDCSGMWRRLTISDQIRSTLIGIGFRIDSTV